MKQKSFKILKIFRNILIVVFTIGFLLAVFWRGPGLPLARSMIAASKGDILAFNNALSLYKESIESTQYPLTLKQLLEDDVPGWDGPYMAGTEIKKDPWGGEYKYISDGENYTIESTGAPEGKNAGYSASSGVMYTF